MRRKEKGLSLIEAAIVLALAAFAIMGALYYYQVAAENKRFQELTELTQDVLSKVLVLYEGRPTTEGLDSLTVAKLLHLKTTKTTITGMGSPYGVTKESDYINIPGNGMLMSVNGDNGLLLLTGTPKELGIGYHFPKQMPDSEVYNICMAVTGANYHLPSSGYSLGYWCKKYHARLDTANRQKACSSEAISERKVVLLFQL